MSGNTGGAPTGGGYHDTSFYTKFNLNDFNGLKKMLDGASVRTVKDVAANWQGLHDDLVGEDGQGGIQKRFTDAVNKVMESWHGTAAERFQKKAQEVVQNFQNGAPYALQTAQVMGQTAKSLQDAIDKVSPVQDGWNWDDNVWSHMPWDDSIDDDDLNDLLKKGASTAGVLEANKDNLTGHQKHRLQAAVAMETLGTSYRGQAASLKAGPGAGRQRIDGRRDDHSEQKDLGGMPMPMGMGHGPGGGGGGGGSLKIPTRGMKAAPKMPETPKMPDQPGINGGMGVMKPKMPDVTTGLEGVQGGGSGGPGLKMPGGGTGGLPGGGGASLHMPSGGGTGGGLSGMPGGMTGGAGMGGRGAGGVKPGAGGAGAAGAGSRSGRAGMPGMGGAHGAGAGKGGAAKGAGGAGGPQARQKGGIIGKTGGKASGGAQGGSGLHRSRGGTAAGTNSGGRRPAGMMGGAHGAQGGKGEGKGQDGNRPDYLVEDEETWTPERNVAPRVIE
ncbi:WXG100 family type VII secretion target [Streptomyces sp. NPDC058000]|uniref:WXG100 family type VII secretion target n=1 Tax=Streptomyces sp. NPDC058000 TaxID=3346299 RepID=UPI0036E6FD4F